MIVTPRSFSILVLFSIFSTVLCDYRLWDNYLNTIGPTLTNTFQYPDTLQHALKNHVHVAGSLHEIITYECHSYKEGEQLGRPKSQ